MINIRQTTGIILRNGDDQNRGVQELGRLYTVVIRNESLPLEKPNCPFPREEPKCLSYTREGPATRQSQAAGQNTPWSWLFREATNGGLKVLLPSRLGGRSRRDHLVKGHHMLLTGGAPGVSPGSPVGIPWVEPIPSDPFYPPQEQSWVSQKLRPTFRSKSQEGLEQGLSARCGYRLGEGFSQEWTVYPSWPQIQRNKKAEHVP